MDKAFDTVFAAMVAWNQIGMIAGGLICFGIGGLLLGYAVYKRISGIQVRGRIADVRATGIKESAGGKQKFTGEMYYPVFEYTARNGQSYRNEDGSGSNWILGAVPGTDVTLLLNPENPEEIYRPGLLMPFFGLVFGLPGIILLYIAFARFEFNIFSVLFALGLIGFLVMKIRKGIKPRSEWDTKESFRMRMKEKHAKKRSEGRLLSEQEIRERVRAYDRYARGYVTFLSIAGVALVFLGAHLGQGMQVFLSGADSAQGRVVRIESVYSNDGDGGSSYTYYAHVSFRTNGGLRTEFRDRVGSSAALYKRDDTVNVLYDPANPGYAIIDRGIWNWAASGGCMGGGALFLLLAIKLFAGIRKRNDRI